MMRKWLDGYVRSLLVVSLVQVKLQYGRPTAAFHVSISMQLVRIQHFISNNNTAV